MLSEECFRLSLGGFGVGLTLHNDICLPYFLEYGNDEQKQRWLPGFAVGELITAIAMTEPGTGSDLAGIKTTAVRDGDDYVINGARRSSPTASTPTSIVAAVKTDPAAAPQGHQLLVVEGDTPGLRARAQPREDRHALAGHRRAVLRGRRVPAANLLGAEGEGFAR